MRSSVETFLSLLISDIVNCTVDKIWCLLLAYVELQLLPVGLHSAAKITLKVLQFYSTLNV